MLHDSVKAYIDRNIHHNFMDNYRIDALCYTEI